MRNFDLSPLMRQWIGFDKLANALQNAGESQSFPPYNIEKSDDNHYRITLAMGSGSLRIKSICSKPFTKVAPETSIFSASVKLRLNG